MALSFARPDPAEPLGDESVLSGRPDALFGRRAKASRTALQLRQGLPFENWQRMGGQIGALNDASAWWIGDWLLFGQTAYPDRYRTAIEVTGLGYQTLRNYAWVSAQFPVYRRRDMLSFGHHAEVAAMVEDDQETWLLRCSTHGWSRNELRRRIRTATPAAVDASEDVAVAVALQVEHVRHARWRAAASAEGRSLGEWIASALDEASESALARHPEHRLTQLAS